MKKLSIIVVCLMLALAGAGCSKIAEYVKSQASPAQDTDSGESSVEDFAVQTEADIAYTNNYLDFSFTVPKDWWLYSINETNFARDPSQTGRPDILDISYGEDAGMNYSFIDLVSFANLRDSRRDNHIGFNISAETLDGVNSIEEYMDYLEAYMLEPDENTYRMIDSGRAEINGIQYEKRGFEVIRKEYNYIYATFTRPAGNNYYLTIKASYWPENRNAETFIADCLSKAMR